jgi:crossover junction endodeoxyribonuclease RuvC
MQLQENYRIGGNNVRFVGIDPSTKTGFVAIDAHGQVLKEKEITGIGSVDPKRMRTMIVDIMAHIQPDDIIAIEGFGFASQQAVQNGGIGWGIRMALDGRKMNYIEVAPNAVKKYVNVSGWEGEKGSKKRLTGPEKKKIVKNAVNKHFNYAHKSDNVIDAYVLAQIALSHFVAQEADSIQLMNYQAQVIETILNPPKKKAK